MAVVLAVGAGLLIRTLESLTRTDAGFRTEATLTVTVAPNPSACRERAACVALYDELLPKTDVFVTNGGYGGVQIALRHGVPIVTSGGKEDKPEVAGRITEALNAKAA